MAEVTTSVGAAEEGAWHPDMDLPGPAPLCEALQPLLPSRPGSLLAGPEPSHSTVNHNTAQKALFYGSETLAASDSVPRGAC